MIEMIPVHSVERRKDGEGKVNQCMMNRVKKERRGGAFMVLQCFATDRAIFIGRDTLSSTESSYECVHMLQF